ncbi:signal peptide peptidase SppA [Novosphingobium sp.]|uniref:signal peptide peptidase SppA n=1 Tax=Novosphingobium sp. TaxID=1874826 RepID=UPI0022CC50C2|nr:signal peptide peptidase SppA [Novosphingobium sp.]MCZ8017988.1 signal peptide peptidase SppA [Novosphingobium sp.]MCZ8034307.1 signal peptide peptidase SppA [Novosphingobium sp.]MCZ8052275.1 signal peptide peptidase SppA [Novosphingobium sp.]MCZ8061297.1 signal peptide peptidase SppA [Novosphingobium sp.]MCZ8232771.1 signal peptide peptidase SppA [Novosphingobium sp.]
MIFARKVWALLVGIKDGLVLLFMLLFFMALYAALTARPSPGQVRDGALLLKLDGTVVEEPAKVDPFELLVAGDAPVKEHRARDVIRTLEAAAEDERIKAVALDLSRFMGGGQVTLQDVGAAIDKVRKANKPVVAFAHAYADDGLLLAAHASEVWVDPLGGAFVMGPGGMRLYYGDALARFKVTPHVFKVGTYKDFVEPYVQNQASPASKEARGALVSAVWEDWQAHVKAARPKADLARVTTDPVGWLQASQGDAAKAALAAGLVDKLGTQADFHARLRALVGPDPLDDSPLGFAHTKPAALLAAHPEDADGAAIAVVNVAGEIVDGKAGPGTAGGTRIAKLIDQANADGAKALVLRVDSPGGSVMGSEEIRTALNRFKAGTKDSGPRPVVVSMANLAASGGYWVSTPADRIFAEPGTITGSIGIFAMIPTFERALADYGVKADGVRSTPLSGQPDLLTGLTPEVKAMIQANIEQNYGRFVGLVAQSRKRSPAEVETYAEGRAWDGGTARQKGLVDAFGGLNEALADAAQRAKLGDEWYPSFYGQDEDPYASLIEQLRGTEDADAPATGMDLTGLVAARQQAGIDRVVNDLARLFEARGAQALCLDCPVPVAVVKPVAAQQGLMARLLGFFGG